MYLNPFRLNHESTNPDSLCDAKPFLVPPFLTGTVRPGRAAAGNRRIWPVPEAAAVVDLPAGVHPVRVLRLQPAVHDRRPARLLVQHSGAAELYRRRAEAVRHSDGGGKRLVVDRWSRLHVNRLANCHLGVLITD